MRDIIEIIIENLTNERLDTIVFEDEEFSAIDDQLNEALANYDTLGISEQDSKEISRIFDIYADYSTSYAALAYKQGLIDSIELLRGLKII